MAALSIAIIGKNKEPLYMRDFKDESRSRSTSLQDDFIAEEELFGLPKAQDGGMTKSSFDCSIQHQFILHSALDRFDQLAGPPPGLAWRKTGVSGNDAMFIGLLCPVEEMRVYGA
jgi:hypothetical protein